MNQRFAGVCLSQPDFDSLLTDGCLTMQAFAVRLQHDEKLAEGSEVYLQFALLYSTTDGQRLVR